nr:structural maintenance of chromosomes protein 1B isoform X2 [Pogona vitticeps]
MGYLKLLVVENFKSWRGQQNIGPFKKFTCVIGPNGSGKSNVMDALSFVMGEKIYNLRVKRIQELIHGAHVGKPVSSTASVKMVYCEENGQEKIFSRIIRGSGSEFLVNGTVVNRSVYIKELGDIGILAKARNCLVFQGEVETIAMKKPKERTQLFEQISNSGELAAEYVEKKKNMQKAEEDAQFSYNKKKNVAVERKRAKLEKEEAEHYQILLQEVQECKTQLQLFQMYHNEQKINLLNSKLSAKNMKIDDKKTVVSHAEDTVKAKKKALGILIRNQQHIEKEIKSLEVLLSQKRPQYIKAKERTSHQIKKVDTAKKALKDHMKELAKQEGNRKELQTELSDIDKAYRAFEKKIEEETVHGESDVLLEENQISKYKELKELVRKKVAILTQQLEKLQWEQKADKEKMTFDQRREKETEGSIKQVVQQIEDHEKRVEALIEYNRTCTASLENKEEEGGKLANEIESSKIRMAEVNEELNKIVSDLHNARMDVHEGKRQQMRAEKLESLKRLYPDYVFGRLVDLCHPIHKKYQLAVTKVFGKYMTAIIVASEKAARDCIRFLKEERAEPETFLPLDYLEVEPINEQLREIKGCKMMIDVIQTSFPSLKKVIQFVCGNGLVCETVKEAKQLAFDGPHRLKTVALDGTLFLKSGIISGGSSYLKMKARYWDEKEMNVLKEQREKLMNELKDLLKIKRKEIDLKHLQAQCQGIRMRQKYSQNELEVLRKKHLASFYKVEDGIFHEFCEEIGVDNIRVYEKEHVQKQEEIDKKRFEFENQKTRLSVQLEYIRSLIEKELKKNNMLKESIVKDEAGIVELKKDEENCLQMVDEVLAELQQLKEKQAVNKMDVVDAQNQVEESRKILLSLNRELVTLQKEALAIETSLEQKKLERHNRLLDCKLQDLRINLLLGSLDDISEIELAPDTESTEKTADIYEREQLIQIDYSSLGKELKAFLSPENPEEPYLEGISYNCVAPGKRFMPMDNLSGGEKSVAALALVFAIHSFRPAPFFVLDEVDAALDNTNIGKVSTFIRQQSHEQFQIIVISLKEEFYSKADALIGVCPQQEDTICSQVLTLDLTQYPDSEESERQQKPRKSSALK